MRHLEPIDTTDLFEPLHEELIALLRSLAADDWTRPTVAGTWRVRDVVAHLLDVDLRLLSQVRDGHFVLPDGPLDSYAEVVDFLNRINGEWVAASRRLSPRVLTDLLATTGAEVAAAYASLPPHDRAMYSVAWAGEAESKNWMHVGRDYTERWHHQMQIRDAVGAPGLFERHWFYPLLDLSMRALPHAYRGVDAAPGTSVVVEVEGPGGGAWSLVRGDSVWTVYPDAAASPAVRIQLDPDTAWKSLYNALESAEARGRSRVEGDGRLAKPFFATRSVMV